MPLTDKPEAVPQSQGTVGPDVKTQQQGANSLEGATPTPQGQPEFDELEGLDLSGKDTKQAPFAPQSEDEEFLFGPTTRPGDKMGANGVTSPKPRRPEGIERTLSYFVAAARQPDAPPELHAFIRALAYHLGEQA